MHLASSMFDVVTKPCVCLLKFVLVCVADPDEAPRNFSRVDLAGLSDTEIRKRFPKFPVSAEKIARSKLLEDTDLLAEVCADWVACLRLQGRQAAKVVDLQAGQSLYLPAGWFHEVCCCAVGAAGLSVELQWHWEPDVKPRTHADTRSIVYGR